MTAIEDAIAGAGGIARRLRDSLAALAPLLPLDEARVAALDRTAEAECDAFLKRFESLVAQLQDQDWPLVLRAEGEDPDGLTRRMVTEFMDRIRLVRSAAAFAAAARLRNSLAHMYPLRPDVQAARLTAAIDLSPLLLDCVARAEAWRAGHGAPP